MVVGLDLAQENRVICFDARDLGGKPSFAPLLDRPVQNPGASSVKGIKLTQIDSYAPRGMWTPSTQPAIDRAEARHVPTAASVQEELAPLLAGVEPRCVLRHAG